MPTWRCPHCGTPQAETSRCWVCKRSSTSCGTCRNFRHSVAAQIGYCGLDPTRSVLRGDEVRPCWESRPPEPAASPLSGRTDVRKPLGFVPVDEPDAELAAPSAHPRPTYGLWADPES